MKIVRRQQAGRWAGRQAHGWQAGGQASSQPVAERSPVLLQVIEGTITDPFILNWLDLLCFLLSGLPASGTVAAEVAFMFAEWSVIP